MNNSSSGCTIVIVSYNCREPLQACLQSLRKSAAASKIIVVDNNSIDNCVAMLREQFPSVFLLENSENKGFTVACNRGIRAADSEFVLLLNPDTAVSAETIPRLLAAMKTDSRVAACGPRILNPDGSLQPSCRRFPTLSIMAAAELGFRGMYHMSGWAHDQTREVDQLVGCCLLLRRAALDEVGLLDERFFLYFEEVDLCWRLKHNSWRVLFVHDAAITHIAGESTRHDRTTALRHRYRDLFAFYRKYFPRWQLVLLKLAVQFATVVRTMVGYHGYGAIAREVWRL